MKKPHTLKKAFSVLIMLLLIVQSCAKDTIEQEDTAIEQQQRSLEITPVVEKLIEMGYDLKSIVEIDAFYVVEGDLMFSKNIKDYPETQTRQHYHSNNLVGDEEIQEITVFPSIYQAFPAFGDGNTWRDAIPQAINLWNTINDESCVRFILQDNNPNADISIIDGAAAPLPANFFGNAGTPPVNGGEPFDTVWINLRWPNGASNDNTVLIDQGSTTLTQKINIITHELGHCIGFNHTDDGVGNPVQGTNGTDPLSVMSGDVGILFRPITGFTPQDVIAVNSLYGGCGGIIIPTGSISGPSSICNNTNPVTYTLTGGNTATSWSTSTNLLQITGSTSTSATVDPINNGSSYQATITAQLAGGGTATRTININGGPTPSGSATISGPSTLQYYQTGLFETSASNFSSSVTVEWVIFSYVFPNAQQHFNMQIAGNNQFLRSVEVLPNTPEGNYTIQCRVSDNCGTYYIDKVFNVKKGKPQIFGF